MHTSSTRPDARITRSVPTSKPTSPRSGPKRKPAGTPQVEDESGRFDALAGLTSEGHPLARHREDLFQSTLK
jgi:hypothetical protein